MVNLESSSFGLGDFRDFKQNKYMTTKIKKYLFSYKRSRPKDHFLAEFEYSVYLSSVLHEIFLPNSTSSVDPKLVLRHQININIKQISKCKEKTTF